MALNPFANFLIRTPTIRTPTVATPRINNIFGSTPAATQIFVQPTQSKPVQFPPITPLQFARLPDIPVPPQMSQDPQGWLNKGVGWPTPPAASMVPNWLQAPGSQMPMQPVQGVASLINRPPAAPMMPVPKPAAAPKAPVKTPGSATKTK